MTVSSEVSITPIYLGTGLVKSYAYNFLIYAETDLIVVVGDTNDIETTLVINTDYEVTGVGNPNGGNVVLKANLAFGYKLVAFRAMKLDQEIEIANQENIYLENMEKGFDKAVMQIQQLQAEINRSLKQSVTSDEEFIDIDIALAQMKSDLSGSQSAQSAAETAKVSTIAAQSATEEAEASTIAAQEATEAIRVELLELFFALEVTGYRLDLARYVQNLDVTNLPSGMDWKPNGMKMYLVIDDAVHEYDLTTPWNISTATFNQSFDASAQDISQQGVSFNTDGTKMYLAGSTNVSVYQYTLSTPWDVSTATFDQSFSVSSQASIPIDVKFKPDGTIMFIADADGINICAYTLSTAWDISTAVIAQTFDASSQDYNLSGIDFSTDGKQMFVAGNGYDEVYEYTLSTAWDISTASFTRYFFISSQTTFPTGLRFSANGMKMFITGGANYIYEYLTGYY